MEKVMNNENDLFEWPPEFYEIHWRDMPEFNQPKNGAFRQIIVSFEDQEGVDEFAKLIQQTLTNKTKSIWFPDRERNLVSDLFYFSDDKTNGTDT